MESLTTIDIGIQVEINNNNDLLIQIETLKNSLNTLVADHAKQVQIIEIKNNKIFELEHKCENLKKQIANFNISLDLYRNQIELLANEKNKLESENNRFSLENLLAYNPLNWLKYRNPVVVKFIEILTDNDNEQLYQKKIFNHVDSHITSGGGYTKFINWIEDLAIEPKSLPDGLLILAFDNEQKGQKNNLDREKNQETNEIDKLVEKQNSLSNKIKKCLNCLESEIDNKKRNCPKYNAKLPTLTSINQESSFQKIALSENTNKAIIFRSYNPKKSSIELQKSKIILEHIGKHKWMPIVCDGVPYNQALKLKQTFPWEIDIKTFARCQGNNNPTPNGYLEWAKKQTNEIYKLKFEQIFIYLQAFVNFCIGVRTNQPLLRNAARHQFAPIWSARRHPIYKLIEISYEETLLNLKPQIREIIENISVISCSGLQNQHQGLDAIIEEINKALKSLIPPIPSQQHWEIAARNYINFLKLRTNLFNIIGYEDNESSEPRTRPNPYIEQQHFRIYLRKKQFLNPIINNTFTYLDGNANLSEEMKSFSILAQEKRQTFIKNTLLQKTKTVWQAIPVTEQEAETLKNETTMKKEELISIINSILVSFPESQRLKYTNLKNKTKTKLLMILQEIHGLNDTEEALDEEYEGNEPANEEIA
ncbi:hypothetical protein F8M41_024116 [Gigaspora margarita]|uniref:Uncharacterized protein n=1 Tax=Gigaspora margarita TaxID=4874 RepID=A0A8H4AC77_GIGMA|nr:hypothetical protein F8M41_024116 [Gigaspora margarita]